jgi:hypothetical protein
MNEAHDPFAGRQRSIQRFAFRGVPGNQPGSDAVLIAAVSALLMLLAGVSPASAHAMTFRPVQTVTLCINSFSSLSREMYDTIPVTNQTWAVQVRVGLSGGNTVQFVRWEGFAQDGNGGPVVAEGRGAVDDWVLVGQYVEEQTLPFHANGQPDVWFSIDNQDSASQCFLLYALAG